MGRRVFTAILPGVSLPPYLSTIFIYLFHLPVAREYTEANMEGGGGGGAIASHGSKQKQCKNIMVKKEKDKMLRVMTNCPPT